MPLLALDSWWNDFYTAGGFWVGVFGTVVGIAGFAIAIYQIIQAKEATRKAQNAAEAAKDAAERTLSESKESHERFIGAYASRLQAELEHAVTTKDWELAKLRCNDLAALLATLPKTGNTEYDAGTTELVRSLRDFAQTFTTMATGKKKEMTRPQATKWVPLLQLLNTRLDHLRRPFREKADG